MTKEKTKKNTNTTPKILPQMLPDNDDNYRQIDDSGKYKRKCGIHSRLLSQLRQVKTPTQSDEELISKIQAGNQEASTLLFYKHYKYILEKIIDATHGNWYSDDILQAGAVGLYEAAARFDTKKHNKFLTYAHYWILKYIYIEMRNELLPLGGIGIGRDAKERLFNYIKYMLLGMSDEEIMEKLRISRKALTELKLLNMSASPTRIRSLDTPEFTTDINEPRPEGLYNSKEIADSNTPYKALLEKELFDYVESQINLLRETDPNLAKFLDYELGLNGEYQLDKSEICVKLDISKREFELRKREGNKYLRSCMIRDGWYDAKQDMIDEEIDKCVAQVKKELQ